jgi:hypothetical protein
MEKILKSGLKISFQDTEIKIMAVVDNYVMARKKGFMPFCMSEKEFKQKFMR